MKSFFSWLSLVYLMLFVALFAFVCIFSPNGHCDFNLRMNELSCLRQGVDPYAVWHEDVVLPPYCSNLPKKPVPVDCTEQVNAYVPWEYAIMLPLSYLPRTWAWALYCVLTGVAMALVFGFSFRGLAGRIDRRDRLLLAGIPLSLVSYLLWSNAAVGNFVAFILAASVVMAWCLSRGYDALAGICWALAMVKPQSVILFAVPLFLRRKWLTCVVAITFCLIATCVPAAMCQSSFLDLLLAGPLANAELFLGCGTYPYFFLGTFGNGVEIGIAMVIGFGLCLTMTSLVQKDNDWTVLLMPAAVCGASWTYTQAYSHAMAWFLAFVLVRELLRNSQSRFLWVMLGLSVLSLSRWFLAWHGLCSFAEWRFPMSEYAFRCVDSLNSTLSILLAMAFCVWKMNFVYSQRN